MARYKVLKSVAHSFGHSFTSLMNYRAGDYVMGHLLTRARESGIDTLNLDIVSGQAAPEELLVPPVRDALAAFCSRFPDMLKSHRTGLEYVRSARMSISFDLTSTRPNAMFPERLESPYLCRVEIEDDRGKRWVSELRDWWFPESEPTGAPAP